MASEGKIRQTSGGDLEVHTEKGWVPIKQTDMGHLQDAVKWWNETGKRHGPKAPEVRRFMLDSQKYELQERGLNRSRGARLPDRYLPPDKGE